jgi:hypothetical protein
MSIGGKLLTWLSGGGYKEYNPPTVSQGAANAGDIPALNASGVLDSTFMPPGLASDSLSVTFPAAASANTLVAIYNNSGTQAGKLADASTPVAAIGFINAAVAAGGAVTIYFSGIMGGLTGLTPGAVYYLSTAGGVTLTSPNTPGQIAQPIGVAISATQIQFNAGTPVTLA